MGKKRNLDKSSYPEQMSLERKNARLAFFLFLAGEIVLFGTLFKKYYDLGLQFSKETTPESIFPFYLAVSMMVILLTSQYTSWKAVHASVRHEKLEVRKWFFITILLGVIFLGLLGYEIQGYVNQPINGFVTVLNSILTLHGLHVLFGVLWIMYLLTNIKRDNHLFVSPRFYMIQSYWQFIVTSGIVIYTIIYGLT